MRKRYSVSRFLNGLNSYVETRTLLYENQNMPRGSLTPILNQPRACAKMSQKGHNGLVSPVQAFLAKNAKKREWPEKSARWPKIMSARAKMREF